MTNRSRLLAAVLAATLVAVPAAPQAHMVTPEDVQARFAQAAGERAANVRTLEALLSSQAATEAAAHLHADLGRIRAGVPSLTDAELRDLAARAESLRADPVAGNNPILIVLAVVGVLFVLLVILIYI